MKQTVKVISMFASIRKLAVMTAAVAGAMLAWQGAAQAQNAFVPTKPIRLLISSAPGGGTDAIGRMLADAMSPMIGQQVVVENRPGAGGVIGSEALMRMPADGYSIIIIQNGHAMNPALMKKLPYDTLKDFTPITTLARSPLVLVGNRAINVKNIKDLVELGRRDPKTLNFGEAEASTRLAVFQLSQASKLPMNVAYYKGTGPAVTDVAAGHINYSVTTIASTIASKDRLNYLAMMTPERSALMPDVPSVAEQGYPGIDAVGWWGILGPANLPRPITLELNRMMRQAMEKPESVKRLATIMAEPWFTTPEGFDQFIRAQINQTIALAKQAGIEPE